MARGLPEDSRITLRRIPSYEPGMPRWAMMSSDCRIQPSRLSAYWVAAAGAALTAGAAAGAACAAEAPEAAAGAAARRSERLARSVVVELFFCAVADTGAGFVAGFAESRRIVSSRPG